MRFFYFFLLLPICPNQENSKPFNTPVQLLFFHYFHLWCLCPQSYFWSSSLFLQTHLHISSPAPSSWTSVTSASSDPCLTLKLPPTLPSPSSIGMVAPYRLPCVVFALCVFFNVFLSNWFVVVLLVANVTGSTWAAAYTLLDLMPVHNDDRNFLSQLLYKGMY